jgi:16S rRNA (uracil1498-N3)-methyltransferase
MVEPLFRFDGALIEGALVDLAGSEGHHAASVRRMRVGEGIVLTDGAGLRARGSVVVVQSKQLSIKIIEVKFETHTQPDFVLVQAIAKGDRDEMAIQACTELGVARIRPWQSNRSISRWDGKEQKNLQRWQAIVDEASKQSLRVFFPVVEPVLDSRGLEKHIATSAPLEIFLVLDPTADASIADEAILRTMATASKISLIVGPEGGLDQSEVSAFESAGAMRVNLGTGVLRTSTAGVAAIAFLSGALGKWR